MSRSRWMVVAFAVVVLTLVVLGGPIARGLEHWLLALHGRH